MFKECLFNIVCSLQRLQAKVLKLVDISYGGENGFNQAIELSAEVLSNVKFIQEKKLIGDSSFSPTGIILALLRTMTIQHKLSMCWKCCLFFYRAIL